jgi:hypothetical protein
MRAKVLQEGTTKREKKIPFLLFPFRYVVDPFDFELEEEEEEKRDSLLSF